ncbi:MAG: hypothetical protein V5A88_09225 [Candidatus Thermoplasmatota archaeon]
MGRNEEGTVPLDESNMNEIICCPGGAEVVRNELKGPLEKTFYWREEMIEKGMKGFVQYENGEATGFVEYMPVGKAPLPIFATRAATLMCFHWVRPSMTKQEHLNSERKLVEKAIEATSDNFTGLAALAWDHPSHFPLDMIKDMGFQVIEKDGYISLVWYPHEDVEVPELVKPSFQPRDLSDENLLAIDQAFSNRCPFSIHNSRKFKRRIEEIDDLRIQHEIHAIDTREDVLRYSISPWEWEWLFLNGKKVENIFRLKKDELVKSINKELKQL